MDVILQKFMEPERWRYALAKGVDKDIRKADLYQLTKEATRVRLYQAVKNGTYTITPPHTAQIPKEEKGEFRTVYVNEPIDRIFLSIANDLLFELMPEMVHKNCKSYLTGTGCGDVVIGISKTIAEAEEYKEEGWRLFGLLKKFLDDNDIDPDKKMAEWAEAKRARRA